MEKIGGMSVLGVDPNIVIFAEINKARHDGC